MMTPAFYRHACRCSTLVASGSSEARWRSYCWNYVSRKRNVVFPAFRQRRRAEVPAAPYLDLNDLQQAQTRRLRQARLEFIEYLKNSPASGLTTQAGVLAVTIAALTCIMACMTLLLRHIQAKTEEVEPAAVAAVVAMSTALSESAIKVARTGTMKVASIPKLVQYRFLQILSLPTFGKIAAILCMGLPIVALGSVLYKAATGCRWSTAATRSYYVMNNVPGTDITAEPTHSAALVLNVVHVISLFSFAVIVGIIADEIAGAVAALRGGNFVLPEQGHTVILGSNRHLVHVLRQVLAAQGARGDHRLCSPVIVLSDEPKDELDLRLMSELGVRGTTVITRHGSPLKVTDLERVAAGQARTVIMLQQEDSEPCGNELSAAAQQAITLATLQAMGTSTQQTIVVQTLDSSNSYHAELSLPYYPLMARSSLPSPQGMRKYEVTTVTDLDNLAGIMAQCAVHPGMSAVFDQLLSHTVPNGCEMYVQRYERLIGRTYNEARRSFYEATVMGVVDGSSGAVDLNPEEHYELHEGDHLVLMARNHQQLGQLSRPLQVPAFPKAAATAAEALVAGLLAQRTGEAPPVAVEPLPPPPPAHAADDAHHYIILCYDAKPLDMLRSLQDFARPGSIVTVLSRQTVLMQQQLQTAEVESRLEITYLTGDIHSRDLLSSIGAAEADSVLVIGLDQCQSDMADAQVMATVLQLQGVLSVAQVRCQAQGKVHRRRAPLNVVCCVSNPRSKEVLHQVTAVVGRREEPLAGEPLDGGNHRINLDVLQPELLLSGVLVQAVFKDLFDEDGDEMYMRVPQYYSLPLGIHLTWSQVQDVVRSAGETALGYMRGSGSQVTLSPTPRSRHAFGPTDVLISLAEG